MASNKTASLDFKKDFITEFNKLCHKNGLHHISAWNDLMGAIACALSNRFEIYPERRTEREKQYESHMARLGLDTNNNDDVAVCAHLLGDIVLEFQKNPEQDLLGELYMNLNMGNKAAGQFFTPYSVAKLAADINTVSLNEIKDKKEYLTIADQACGSGCMLLASAAALRDKNYDPNKKVLFVAQDVDITACYMAYIQLSLLGYAAVICHGNTLSDPYNGDPLFIENGSHLWYTNATYNETWTMRRLNAKLTSSNDSSEIIAARDFLKEKAS